MKNFLAFLTIIATTLIVIGCAQMYDLFGTTPEEVHTRAVQTVSDYAEAAVVKKIEASENLSPEGKEKLKAEVAKLKAEILARIEEIRAKTGDAAEK